MNENSNIERTGRADRKFYLDNIRWIAVLVVVFYHVIYMYNAVGVPGGLGKITKLDIQYCDLFAYVVYPWIMPVLFIVSGISSKYYLDRHTDREFIKNRSLKLLVPSTIGLFVFQFIQGYVSMSLANAFESFKSVPKPVQYFIMVLSGQGVLWYAQILWVFCLVLVLVRKIEKGRLSQFGAKTNLIALLLLAVLVWGAGQILNTPVIVVYRFGFYGVQFLLGYYVFPHMEVIEKVKRWFILFCLVAVALGIAFCIMYFGQNYADAPVNRTPVFAAYSWFACLAVLGGMAKYGDFSNRFTKWMSQRSFGLYIFHYLGISSVALYIGKPGNIPVLAVYLLSLVAGFLAGYGLYALISRIPFFRWAVLGIRK